MKLLVSSLLLLLAIAFVSSQDLPSSDVVVLTDKTFDKTITSGGNYFVKFYAPWCGHCKKLAPTWEELATKTDKDIVKYAKIDCTVEKATCAQFKVRGYPTLMLFTDNGKAYYEYKGERKVESFNSFAAKPFGTKIPVAPEEKGAGTAIELTKDNFDQTYNGNRWIVAFYTSWCSYCKKYLPNFENLSSNYKNSISFGKVNCETQKELCELYRIPGYPTFKFFEGNGIRDFSMEPTESNFKYFLEKGYIDSHLHIRPWHKIISVVQEAIMEYVWLFLGVAFTLGLFLGWVFFSSSKQSAPITPEPVEKEIKQD